jgi:NAD(P)-dependent dehydrogenase (short-subunit alcohol dehydrogenase family)
MQLGFEAKTAVVTGAASGLGREVAKVLAASGARVIGLDVVPFDLQGVQARIVDIGSPQSIDAAVESLGASIDVLCNVAGLPQTKPGVDVLRVNFLGLRHLTETLAPRMAHGAAVTNVASIAGNGWPDRRTVLEEVLATPDFASGLEWVNGNLEGEGDPYTFSKELVQLYTLTRSHSLYRDHAVRMNCVSPGVMETAMMPEFRKAMSDKVMDGIATGSTLGRMGTPEEVAPTIVFLSSPSAALCSGSNFVIDGGYSASMATGQFDTTVFS